MSASSPSTVHRPPSDMRPLPEGWVWTTLQEVAKINGRDIEIRDLPDDLLVTFVPMAAVDAISGTIANPVVRPLKEVRKGFTPFSDGDVIIAKITPCMENGKAAIARNLVNGRGFGSTEFHVFRPSERVLPEFLFHFIRQESFRKDAKAQFAGTAGQLRVPASFLYDYPIPLPPLPEQERIVARLEELLSDLDAGVAALRRVQAGAKRYKASVLKAAFEGRLVPQGETGESATVLLERILGKDYAMKIAPPESSKVPYVPPGWAYGKLENLIYIAGRIGWRGLKANEYTQEGPLFLSVYNLNKGDRVDFGDVYHISQERYDESPEIQLCENDILLAKDGAGIGKIGIVKILPGQATVNSSLLVIRASEIFIPEFLFYLLKGPQMQDIVRARITGSATPHLFQRDIKQFTLLIPPLEEQRRIGAEVERRLESARAVESAAETGLKRARRLRQAVLRSAFEGRLVNGL